MVSTHLKNISQIGNLPQIEVKIRKIWNHHLENKQTNTFWGELNKSHTPPKFNSSPLKSYLTAPIGKANVFLSHHFSGVSTRCEKLRGCNPAGAPPNTSQVSLQKGLRSKLVQSPDPKPEPQTVSDVQSAIQKLEYLEWTLLGQIMFDCLVAIQLFICTALTYFTTSSSLCCFQFHCRQAMAERRISVMGRRLAQSWSSGDLIHFKDSIWILMLRGFNSPKFGHPNPGTRYSPSSPIIFLFFFFGKMLPFFKNGNETVRPHKTTTVWEIIQNFKSENAKEILWGFLKFEKYPPTNIYHLESRFGVTPMYWFIMPKTKPPKLGVAIAIYFHFKVYIS